MHRSIRFFVSLFLPALLMTGCGFKPVSVPEHSMIRLEDPSSVRTVAMVKVKRARSESGIIGQARYADLIPSRDLWQDDLPDIDYRSEFNALLESQGYRVLGDPNDLFDRKEAEAELIVGALIEKIRLDIFYPSLWGNFTYGNAAATMDVEWQVRDALEGRVVYRKRTHGAANIEFSERRISRAFLAAYRSALSGLLADQEFVQLVTGGSNIPSSARQGSVTPTYAGKGDARALDTVLHSVVTIQLGSTHGSGFVVAAGHVLTNAHVVGNSEDRVRILTGDGKRLEGRVLDRDPRRDVALISVPDLDTPPLRIRRDPVRIGEEVYALGSPLDIKLAGTVTRGIISQVDREVRGQRWLQADATINPGNSGGPLVDGNGNVVGISTLARTDGTGIYFFIPIMDGLEKAGVR